MGGGELQELLHLSFQGDSSFLAVRKGDRVRCLILTTRKEVAYQFLSGHRVFSSMRV